MKRNVRLVLLAVGVYAIFLVVTLPARVAVRYLVRDLPSTLTLAGAHGTVWDGQATLMIISTSGLDAQALSTMHFALSPLALLIGRMRYDLSFKGALAGAVQVAWEGQAVTLSNLRITVPAQKMAPLMPTAQSMGPSGLVTVTAHRLVWAAHPMGIGTLTWTQAGLVSAPVNPLGSYTVRFGFNAAGFYYRIRTLQGPLWIHGHGRDRFSDNLLTFNGIIKGRGYRLSGLLQTIGQPDGAQGRAVMMQVPFAF